MPYRQEFKNRIQQGDFSRFLQLWEEYCHSDSVEADEFSGILELIKSSEMARAFGPYVETALPLWSKFEDKEDSYKVLRLLFDLETTNSKALADLVLKTLKERYGNQPNFESRLKLVGLRTMENFQGALRNFDLLCHMAKGKYVFHNGGWGTGQIIDVSILREQISVEFENVMGRRDVSFENAFKTLVPLSDDHFLSRRFGDADRLEKEGRENPIELIRLLLRDLGPKTAAEIKDELCELVIPEADWVKWWQGARTKLKKDTLIQSPNSIKEPFCLLNTEISHEDRLHQEILQTEGIDEILLSTYNFVRDFPNTLKKEGALESIRKKIEGLLNVPGLTEAQELQVLIFLENLLNCPVQGKSLKKVVEQLKDPEAIVDQIPIVAFKKRYLVAMRDSLKNWEEPFLHLFLKIPQNPLRDYIYEELQSKETLKQLEQRIDGLLLHPEKHPDTFLWLFQKVRDEKDGLLSDKEGQCRLLESLFVLLHRIEGDPKHKDTVKKIYNLISGKRYEVIRQIIEGSSVDFIKEFLLLVTKCHTFTDHDMKTMKALAAVAHPQLKEKNEKAVAHEEHVIWTTQEGYQRIRDRIERIGTVEIVENAREIEAARALGDLRENSEYKFALEKRSRLQGELRTLSEQIGRARVITEHDVAPDEVGIGSVVDLVSDSGQKITYTILGPWDANPDDNILSSQSKLAMAMSGCRRGDQFSFKQDTFTVSQIRNIFKK